jgi:hypothetical protein
VKAYGGRGRGGIASEERVVPLEREPIQIILQDDLERPYGFMV